MDGAQAKKMLLAVEIDEAELTLRIAEKCLAMKRPAGVSAADALAELEGSPANMANGYSMVGSFRAAGQSALLYFQECVNAARQPS